MVNFRKPEACGQTVLPDRSSQKGQIIDENAKIKNVNNGQFWLVFET